MMIIATAREGRADGTRFSARTLANFRLAPRMHARIFAVHIFPQLFQLIIYSRSAMYKVTTG